MKKLIALVTLLSITSVCFAYQPPVTSYYTNGADVVAITLDPSSGFLFMNVNNMYSFVFSSTGADANGFHWHCDQFGDLLFSRDTTILVAYEYSSCQTLYFTLMN